MQDYNGHQLIAINVQKLFYYCLNIYLRINFSQRQWNESRTTLPYKIKAMKNVFGRQHARLLDQNRAHHIKKSRCRKGKSTTTNSTGFQFLYTTACWENNYARTRKIWLLWNPPVCSFHVLICKYAELSDRNQRSSDHFYNKICQHIQYI